MARTRRPLTRSGRAQRRDRRLVAAAAAVTLLGLIGSVWHVAQASPPPPEVISVDVAAGPDRLLTVGFAGDTMLADAATEVMKTEGVGAPLVDAARLLDADFTVVNAEGPITARPPVPTGKRFLLTADPATAAAIKKAGADALALGNNHAMDLGAEGLTDTRNHAAAADLATFGAGNNLAEAERPLLVRSDSGTVAVVAFGENFGAATRAAADAPGMVSMTAERVQRGADLARAAGAQRVVAFVHWGDNYADVNPQQRFWADVFARAGYDAVVGSGPHVTQPVELVSGVPVAWSVGNFMYGSIGRYAKFGKEGIGLVTTLSWPAGDGPHGVMTVRCLVTDNKLVRFKPKPCDAAQAARYLPALNPAIRVQGDTGRLQW